MSYVGGAKPKMIQRMISGLFIDLERSSTNQAYFPGEIVRGDVVVVNTEFENHVQDLYLEAKGFTSISECYEECEPHSEEEFHLDLNIPLWTLGGTNSGDIDLRSTGIHRFPFSFTLPHSIPMSFEIDRLSLPRYYNCSVKYSVKAIMKRMASLGAKPDYVFEMPITIDTVVDVSSIERPFIIDSVRKTSEFGKIFIQTAPIEKGGYVPGEKILFNAMLQNCSGKPIRKTSVRLVQNVELLFKGISAGKYSNTIAQHKNYEQFADKSRQAWKNVPIIVPPCLPSGPPNCNLIKISYTLVLDVNLGTFFNNSTVNYSWKVAIGNVSSDSVASTLAVQNLQNSISASYNSDSNGLLLIPICPYANAEVEQFQEDISPINTSANSSSSSRPPISVTQVLAINNQSNDAGHRPSAPVESEIESSPPSYEECIAHGGLSS